MGTSRAKPDAPPSAPLVPPWANEDPPAPPPIPPKPEPAPPADDSPDDEVAEPRRYAGYRVALGRFVKSGNADDARTALGRWAARSSGGSSAGAQRLGRATRTGGGAISGLARAIAGVGPESGALDLRTLAGQPVDSAIAAILDAFMPAGIIDEVVARLAVEHALATALKGVDTFDPSQLSGNAVKVATLAYVAELVFAQVVGDAGRSIAAAGPVAAAQRERDIRRLVKEVVDFEGGPLISDDNTVLTAKRR